MEQKPDVRHLKEALPNLSDEEIIALYFDRNEKAIKETDVKYGKYLYTIAYNIVYDRMDCEECLNDTYLSTWNTIPPHRPPVFQVYLSKIMRNTAIDKYRHSRAAKRVPSEMVVSLEEFGETLPDHTAEEEETVRELSRALSGFLHTLNDREQFVFVCRYYYADRVSVIARMLQVSENTVTRELAGLRQALKEYLQKEGIFYE